MPSTETHPANRGAASILIASVVAMVAIAGLIIRTSGAPSGAITLQDQAVYDISMVAFNRCDPDTNPFIESPIQRINCCTGQCFSPCIANGIQDCLETCKTVCQGNPVYRAGGIA